MGPFYCCCRVVELSGYFGGDQALTRVKKVQFPSSSSSLLLLLVTSIALSTDLWCCCVVCRMRICSHGSRVSLMRSVRCVQAVVGVVGGVGCLSSTIACVHAAANKNPSLQGTSSPYEL